MSEERKLIRVQVIDKVATLVDSSQFIVGGNDDYDIEFLFDGEWSKYPIKTALFVYGNTCVERVIDGGRCEGISIEGVNVFGVGVFSGDISTTTPAFIECKQSIRDLAKYKTPVAPSEDVYAQIIALLNQYIAEVNDIVAKAVEDYLVANPPEAAFSPIVSVAPIEGGHRVTITNINESHTFDVMNGAKGERGEKGDKGDRGVQGERGEQGIQGEAGYTPQRGVDYWTPGDVATIEGYVDGSVAREVSAKVEPQLRNHEIRISSIEQHISDDYFVTDNSVAYEKVVPARACSSAKLLSLGGMTYRDEAKNTLRDSKVTEIKSYGANLADIYGFSADAMNTPSANRELSNSYGTTLSTTDAGNSITVSQTKYINTSNPSHYANGFFCIGINQDFAEGDEYTFSCDIKIDNILNDAYKMGVMPNGNKLQEATIVNGRFVAKGIWTNSENRKFIEIRLAGISATFSNFTLERGHTDGKYKPMREPISYPIPAEIQVGKGVNGYANTIDFDTKKSIQKVREVDMGELNYGYRFNKNRHIFNIDLSAYGIQGLINTNTPINALADDYRAVSVNDTWVDRDMAYSNGMKGTQIVEFVDNRYTNVNDFKAAVTGKKLLFALETPIETDISEALDSFDNIIEVEGGGSLEFVNEFGNAVPSAVKYLLKEESAV